MHDRSRARIRSSAPMLAASILAAGLATADCALAQDMIEAHRRTKARLLADLDEERWAETLAAAGLHPAHPHSESVAVYVHRRLLDSEREELAALGVEWTDVWVPPVPGRHPEGFHLARVPYDAVQHVRGHALVSRLASTELPARPHDDLAALMIDLDDVREGTCTIPGDGAGVRIAVCDSGVDLTHPDLPPVVEAYDVTDGATVGSWGTDVSNTVTGHGTHVSGIVVGDGSASAGKYAGAAPAAAFHFYKIGNDFDGSSTYGEMILAIDRARAVGCSLLNMSYGGFTDYMDGSSPVAQTLDAARADGMLSFFSVGNEADAGLHASTSVPAGGSSPAVELVVDNSGGWYSSPIWIWLQLVWRDGSPGDGDLSLACTNLAGAEFLSNETGGTSPRSTEAKGYWLYAEVPAGASKAYQLVVSDATSGGPATTAHLFDWSYIGYFADADPATTVLVPALADGAVGVGAWTQRREWTDSDGYLWFWDFLTVDTLAPFSNRGPRIDGRRKPDIVAPGATTISLRDEQLHTTPWAIIDDDGVYGQGGAHYFVDYGTSYAAPLAAGTAALLLQADPSLTPDEIEQALTSTASRATSPDHQVGHGLIDAHAALQSLGSEVCPPLVATPATLSVAAGGVHELALNAGPELADDIYLVLGSASGTGPGPMANGFTLPLTVPDAYFELSLVAPNVAPFTDTFGTLDFEGRAAAAVDLGAGGNPTLAGLELHHAFVVLAIGGQGAEVALISNPTSLTLAP